ncbi:hydrolase [Sphingomonas oligoaromativorans]|uniref:hydrolase n=1 Tax=Sphingomonas oligoaromativorans TaxID=575322 RepID=UPI0014235A1B|nr:hydrolase [Sphingomonas oligoaromativorans]NIJ33590.1 glutamate carboxypeptidase [Sphingomonas oligoaromativorans]
MFSLRAEHRLILDRAAGQPMLEQTLDWAAINSGTGNLAGLKTVAGKLADAFSALPGKVELLAADPVESILPDGATRAIKRGRNLHLAVRPAAPVQLLLTGHMDTVFAADHPFQKTVTLDDGRINGPGVADMKGGLAIMLAALTALEASPLRDRVGYEVVINSDEETGSHGSAGLIARAAKGKVAALTYEPSARPDGLLAGARPGSGNFSIIVTGRSAHAGRNPEDGRNAVLAAADLALRLAKAAGPRLTVNPARIDGGGPNNVVPDHAVLRVNLRPTAPEDELRAKSHIDAAIAMVAAEHDVHIHMHGSFARPPKPLGPQTEKLFELVRECGEAIGQTIAWAPSGGVCDGNNIAAAGVPVVDTMGARGGAIHSGEEFLIVESLAERARLSALVLLELAERGRA